MFRISWKAVFAHRSTEHNRVRQRILLALELVSECISRSGEQANALIRDVLASFPDQLLAAIANRMRHDKDGKARMPYTFTDHLREGCKRGADHRDSGNAEIFECGRVTRGPGGRRTSVADTVDDSIALRSHLPGVW